MTMPMTMPMIDNILPSYVYEDFDARWAEPEEIKRGKMLGAVLRDHTRMIAVLPSVRGPRLGLAVSADGRIIRLFHTSRPLHNVEEGEDLLQSQVITLPSGANWDDTVADIATDSIIHRGGLVGPRDNKNWQPEHGPWTWVIGGAAPEKGA